MRSNLDRQCRAPTNYPSKWGLGGKFQFSKSYAKKKNGGTSGTSAGRFWGAPQFHLQGVPKVEIPLIKGDNSTELTAGSEAAAHRARSIHVCRLWSCCCLVCQALHATCAMLPSSMRVGKQNIPRTINASLAPPSGAARYGAYVHVFADSMDKAVLRLRGSLGVVLCSFPRLAGESVGR